MMARLGFYLIVAVVVGAVHATAAHAQDGACQSLGNRWESAVKETPTLSSGHFTMIVFLEGSQTGAEPCYYGNARDYGVVGDPIYVGVVTQDTTKWTGVRFEPCALQSASPAVLASSELFPAALRTFSRGDGTPEWKLVHFLPRTCFNSALNVTPHGPQGNAEAYPLRQYERYRATLNAGILFSKLHDAQFALRTDQAEPSRKYIYDKAATERGPEYVATLQLYSIARYLPSLVHFGQGQTYPGRDPIHDQGLWDRLGAILGAGIKNPTKRFTAGASFELIYGVSAIWVEDFAKVNRLLPSVSMDQPFSGADTEIPTRESWQSRGTLGLSIDLRYLSILFTGNRQ
jgi:hypothetical protein